VITSHYAFIVVGRGCSDVFGLDAVAKYVPMPLVPPSLSLIAPLTPNALNAIHRALRLVAAPLQNPPCKDIVGDFVPPGVHGTIDAPRWPVPVNDVNAAVLIPLCNVEDVPGLLMEVRGQLRTHSGEVRCVDAF
jgi:hypothetical protein